MHHTTLASDYPIIILPNPRMISEFTIRIQQPRTHYTCRGLMPSVCHVCAIFFFFLIYLNHLETRIWHCFSLRCDTKSKRKKNAFIYTHASRVDFGAILLLFNNPNIPSSTIIQSKAERVFGILNLVHNKSGRVKWL